MITDPQTAAPSPAEEPVARARFTIVFEGDLSSFNWNPLKATPPFGKPIAVGFGDAFQRIDELEALAHPALAPAAGVEAGPTLESLGEQLTAMAHQIDEIRSDHEQELYARDQMLATVITNLRHDAPVADVLKWYDEESTKIVPVYRALRSPPVSGGLTSEELEAIDPSNPNAPPPSSGIGVETIEAAAKAMFEGEPAYQSTGPNADLWTWEKIDEISKGYWRELARRAAAVFARQRDAGVLEALAELVTYLADHDEEGLIEHAPQMMKARAALITASVKPT